MIDIVIWSQQDICSNVIQKDYYFDKKEQDCPTRRMVHPRRQVYLPSSRQGLPLEGLIINCVQFSSWTETAAEECEGEGAGAGDI